MTPTARFGAQLWSQATDWPTLRDAALLAERSGWDSIWTWDHLNAIFGPWDQPILEGWSVLAALAPLTSRARLGLMVGANTFRNPGLTATAGAGISMLGPPDVVADAVRPYLDLGFGTVIVRLPAPYDRETIERIGEVGAHLRPTVPTRAATA